MIASNASADAKLPCDSCNPTPKPMLARGGVGVHHPHMGKTPITVEQRKKAVEIGKRVVALLKAKGIRVNEADRKMGRAGQTQTTRIARGTKISVDAQVWIDLARICEVTIDEILIGTPPKVPVQADEDPRFAERRIVLEDLEEEGARIDPVVRDHMLATKLKPGDAGDYPWWKARYFSLIDERKKLRDELRERAEKDAGHRPPAPAQGSKREKRGGTL